jgi:uncharacterized protein (DUF4415 family)
MKHWCDERAEMKDKNITVVSKHHPRKRKTDLAHLAQLNDKDTELLSATILTPRRLMSIGPRRSWSSLQEEGNPIRVDPDVLDYFKKEGAGYQRRINAVLRSYVEQKQKRGKSA